MAQGNKVLVVGAGVTGAALSHLLQDAKQALKYVPDVVVWEKNNIAGGRMMARSFRKNRSVHVDIGAQYLTKFTTANDDFRARLVQKHELVPFDESAIAQDSYHQARRTDASDGKPLLDHAICPDALGFRSMVQELLEGTPTILSQELERFEVLNDTQIKVVSVDGREEMVNNLVLTCPVPNVLPILDKSTAFPARAAELEALAAVQYSQRFALAYLFNGEIASQVQKLGWISKYVSEEEDDVVRYLCWDNLKKQRSTGENPYFTLLVHTSVPFGVKNMDNKRENDEILATITKSVKKILPFLPDEEDVIMHRWRISQVTKPYREASIPALVISESPKIVLAGDAFLGSTFDNCLLSAKAAANIITKGAISSGL
uniref:Amine oxidase domain-containing protein n=1 Tax=Globisporangium ultimum (strain ATCC 200006 / CBS 805.95 / DAOM BR144) TaxID=431595 RepID=K3WAW0_GLOUD